MLRLKQYIYLIYLFCKIKMPKLLNEERNSFQHMALEKLVWTHIGRIIILGLYLKQYAKINFR